ncbi:MAG: hypothetical protein Q7P63_17475 [Verrucomicrobiota bacterium JB022]|nr:hypothetical protein [Verrucomicrobiota bacterium JB022]
MIPLRALILTWLLVLPCCALLTAQSLIENTAWANFVVGDASGSVSSESVTVTFTATARLFVGDDQSQTANPGARVVFSHWIENRGNAAGTATFSLSYDAATVDTWRLFVDRNANGQIDVDDTPLSAGWPLTVLPGQRIALLLQATVAETVDFDQTLSLVLGATSANGWSAQVNDTIRITAPQLAMPRKMLLPGADGTNGYAAFRVAYTRETESTAVSRDVMIDGNLRRGFLLIDPLPSGTEFVSIENVAGGQIVYALHDDFEGSWQTSASGLERSIAMVGIFMPALPEVGGTASFDLTLWANPAVVPAIRNRAYLLTGAPSVSYRELPTEEVEAELTGTAPTVRFTPTEDDDRLLEEATVGLPLVLSASLAACNLDRFEIETTTAVITAPTTGDRETVLLVETGPNTGIFVNAQPLPTAEPEEAVTEAEDGVLVIVGDEYATASVESCLNGGTVTALIWIIEPGIVFDSLTGDAIEGVLVRMVHSDGDRPSIQTFDAANPAPASQTSSAFSESITEPDGDFLLACGTDGGLHLIEVVPPAGYAWPSAMTEQELPSWRRVDPMGSYGKAFWLAHSGDAVDFDIPIDPKPIDGLFLEKRAEDPTVQAGELVRYELTLRNSTNALLSDVVIFDRPAPGFHLERDTVRRKLDGRLRTLPERPYAHNGGWMIPVGNINSGDTVQIVYHVRVANTVSEGRWVNVARAFSRVDNRVNSNPTSASVEVTHELFAATHTLTGQVFADLNANGSREKGEPGLEGIVLVMEDGRMVRTDRQGRYHLDQISDHVHLIRLDPATLPEGWTTKSLNARQVLGGMGRILEGFPGELWVADFGLIVPEKDLPAVQEAAEATNELSQALQRSFTAEDTSYVNRDIVARTGLPHSPSQRAPQPPALSKEEAEPWLAQGAEKAQERMPKLDRSLAILDLQDGQRVPPTLAIRAKGQAGAQYILLVDERPVDPKHLGARVVDQERGIELWEFAGIQLEPGRHTIAWVQRDGFGNERGRATRSVFVPGKPATIRLSPVDPVAAPDSTTAAVVELFDAEGNRVFGRHEITLADEGIRWTQPDLDPAAPGLQTVVNDGQSVFTFRSADEVTRQHLSVSFGDLTATAEQRFATDARPFMLTGLVAAEYDGSAFDWKRHHDAAEDQPLYLPERLNGEKDRVAFYGEGSISENAQLKIGYDSERDGLDQSLHTLDGQARYPVFGDNSVNGYGAVSRSPWYGRLDWHEQFAEWGEFTVGSGQAPFREITRFRRNVTGVRTELSAGGFTAYGWAAESSGGLQSVELQGDGTSGPYAVGESIEPGSVQITLIVRDRATANDIVREEILNRYLDYEVDHENGEIYLLEPLASLDPDLNPQSLLITYESTSDTSNGWSSGGDLIWAGDSGLTIGVTATNGLGEDAAGDLYGAFASIPVTSNSTLEAEWATSSALSPEMQSIDGDAYRFDYTWSGTKLEAGAHFSSIDEGFTNPSAATLSGRDEASLDFAYNVSNRLRLQGRSVWTERPLEDVKRFGYELGAQTPVGDDSRVGILFRHVEREDEYTNGQVDSNALGVTAQTRLNFSLPTDLSIQALQDLERSDARQVNFEANQELPWQFRSYLRHEWTSQPGVSFDLDERLQRHTTLWGLERRLKDGGRAFHELRGEEEFEGGNLESALGMRRRWTLPGDASVGTTFERTTPLRGDEQASLATTVSYESADDADWKANSRAEYRHREDSDRYLAQVGAGLRLTEQWTVFGRGIMVYETSDRPDTGDTYRWRALTGTAYRPGAESPYTWLARYEFRQEHELDTRNIHQLMTDLHYEGRDFDWSLHYALKFNQEDLADIGSFDHFGHLIGARVSRDITERFDIGLRGYVLADAGGGQRYSYGPEIGVRLGDSTRLIAGYNFSGFTDRDFDRYEDHQEGFRIGIRWAFDESILSWIKRRD